MTGPVLTLTGVSHSYRGRDALREVSVEIRREVTALIGVNGAGKSTFMNVAAGGLSPTSGSVLVDGKSIYERRTRRQALQAVALMPQTASFPGNMTVREVVEYLTWMRGARAGDARTRAERALETVELADRAGSKIRELSGGMLRRVGLAQAVAMDPSILLLDEPSTGLDPEQRRIMVDRLRELDAAVVLSSHVMEDVSDLADRVLVLDAGTIVFDGTLPDLCDRAPDPSAPRAAEAGFLAVLATRSGVAR